MREVMLKLTMDYKMTKHMLNNCTLKESRTWLLVCTRHCYFIPFNHEHPVGRVAPVEPPYATIAKEEKVVKSVDKVMVTVFWHTERLMRINFLDYGININGEYHASLLKPP